MTAPKIARERALALTILGLVLALAGPCSAESVEDAGFAALQAEAKVSLEKVMTPFMETYCIKCHGQNRQKGGINFQAFLKDPGTAAAGKRWKQAIANVRTHDMPPDDQKKIPTDEERRTFIDSIDLIKYLSPKDPGPFVIRRLTKVEYGNTLRDLFEVEPELANELPDEVFGEGYLNTISSLQSEQYLGIANEILDRILAPEDQPPTEMQMRLFGEPPAPGVDRRKAARTVALSLAKMAYRRPPSEAEVEVLLRVFDLGQVKGLAYPSSLGLMLKAILVSPQFLFITPSRAANPSEAIISLDDYQLASRLSYLLWATMPDAELFSLADEGKLHEPAIYQGQINRLLADDRSRALFDGFGAQWLGLGELDRKTFDTEKFPQMTDEMRLAMYDEARLFFESVVRENRSVVSFVDSDYTFLNGTLASLYGMENDISGSAMRRVTLTDANRGGVIGMPGILATTSFPNRTSPVKRGVWVLEQILGEVIPPPPPDVPELEKQNQEEVANLTLRQRTELHQTEPTCANCHQILDPIGFGLENFDAIGRWRTQDDTGGAIDVSGEMPGGKRFTKPTELKAILADRKEDVARNLTEKFLAYALCRPLEGYDHIVVDRLMDSIAADDFRMHTLVTEVVRSYPFLNHRIQETPTSKSHGP